MGRYRHLANIERLSVQGFIFIAAATVPVFKFSQNSIDFRNIVAIFKGSQAICVDLIVTSVIIITFFLSFKRETADFISIFEAKVINKRICKFFQSIFLIFKHQFFNVVQRIDHIDSACVFNVISSIVAVAHIANMLAFCQAVRFQEGIYQRHVMFTPYIMLNIIGSYKAIDDDIIIFKELFIQFFISFKCFVMRWQNLQINTSVIAIGKNHFQNFRIGNKMYTY